MLISPLNSVSGNLGSYGADKADKDMAGQGTFIPYVLV